MSDLLNQASLVMVPSGYKEDTVYSVVPSDGSGDLSFTRASNGTRINSAGLVEVCPWNLCTYSEDLSNSAWTKGGTSVTADATTAPNGTTTADKLVELATTEQHQSYLSIPVNAGQYTYSVYLKQAGRIYASIYPQGSSMNAVVTVNLSTGVIVSATGATYVSSSIESVGNGWYRVTATLNTTANNLACVVYLSNVSGGQSPTYTGNGTDGIFVWGAQLNIGSTAKPYFPTTDRLNVPRLTYQNGGGGCPSLLLEKQSTNLFTYSEDFDNAGWSKARVSVTANTTTSPDGTQNADSLVEDTTLNSHPIYRSIITSNATAYTITIFAKQGSRQYLRINATNGGSPVIYDLLNKTAGSGGSIVDFGNGWCRLIYTYTTNSTSGEVYIEPSINGITADYLGNGSTSTYLYGAQLEASSYPTSYIPTTSSSATRVADAGTTSLSSSIVNASEGVLFLDFQPSNIIDDYPVDFQLQYNGTSSVNGVTIYQVYNTPAISVRSGGLTIFTASLTATTAGTRNKIALAYKANDYAVYQNGVQKATQSSGVAPVLLNQLRVSDGTRNFSINEAIIFPTRLSNSDLQALTTI